MGSSTLAGTESRAVGQPRQVEAGRPGRHPSDPRKVERTDIQFFNVQPGRVRIQVTVRNPADTWSQPELLRLQAAPLGAFLPWKELGEIPVPAIEPRGSARLEMDARAPSAEALGDFSNVPPRRLLTALASDDDPQSHPDREPARQRKERRRRQRPGTAMARVLADLFDRDWERLEEPTLPDDPLELLGCGSLHWAGNVNVLIGRQATERHLAQALRVHAGRRNLACFAVGDRPDDYKFAFSGAGSCWNAALFNTANLSSLLQGQRPDSLIPTDQWTPLAPHSILMLAVCPPHPCEEGNVNVHVRQRSTDREAIVEFSLDPRAAGPGCYTV